MDTKMIDQLFLELAQVTKAATPKENRLEHRIRNLRLGLNRARMDLNSGVSITNVTQDLLSTLQADDHSTTA